MCSCHYPRMLCHVFWSQVEYKIVCFISSARRLAFLSFDIFTEKFLENSLHLYLMYSHLIMGSAKEEPSLANAWISVLRESVKCLSCVKELLNFQYALPLHIPKLEQSSVLWQNGRIVQME